MIVFFTYYLFYLKDLGYKLGYVIINIVWKLQQDITLKCLQPSYVTYKICRSL